MELLFHYLATSNSFHVCSFITQLLLCNLLVNFLCQHRHSLYLSHSQRNSDWIAASCLNVIQVFLYFYSHYSITLYMANWSFSILEPFSTDFQLESGFLSERYSSIFIYLQSLFNYSFHGQLVISILEPFSTDFQLESGSLFE